MAEANLLSTHGRALVCVARDPGTRLRDIAQCLDITERTALRIVSDLCEHGYLRRERHGTRNRYEIELDKPLADPLLGDFRVRELLGLLAAEAERGGGDPDSAEPGAVSP